MFDQRKLPTDSFHLAEGRMPEGDCNVTSPIAVALLTWAQVINGQSAVLHEPSGERLLL